MDEDREASHRGAAEPWPASLPETLLFDMDGTVLDLHFDNVFWREHLMREVARRASARGDCAETACASLLAEMTRLRGQLAWYCVEHWADAVGFDLMRLKDDLRDLLAWQPGAETLLGALRARGHRLVLVTNAHPKTLAFKDGHLGVRRYFDATYSAHAFAAPKEDPRFWRALLEAEPGLDLARAWLVDDNFEVLTTARAAGVAAVWGMRRPDRARPPLARAPFPLLDELTDLDAHLRRAGRRRPRR